jgi:hypothetical protein
MNKKESCVFSISEIYRTKGSKSDPPTVLVIVNSDIRPNIHEALTQYVSDLEHIEGYAVIVNEAAGGSAIDLKKYFVDQYHALSGSNPLAGCVLVGDLPIPWYGNAADKYPIDLFYMDVNGVWDDTDHDGVIDQCPDQPDPAIWIGRLTAGPLNGDEAVLLNNYFTKNHSYRSGMLNVLERAMAYVDDDWIPKGDYGLSSAYANVSVVNDAAVTNASDYKGRLAENYEFIHCAVHSSPTAHTFKINYAWDGSVTAAEISNLNPQPVFYCLDACQAARYTEGDYIGGWYIFAQGHGLAFIGETKNANSMDGPAEFYTLFGGGLNLGDAFITWLRKRSAYHNDRTILGDPTLKRRSYYPRTDTNPPAPPSGVGVTIIS